MDGLRRVAVRVIAAFALAGVSAHAAAQTTTRQPAAERAALNESLTRFLRRYVNEPGGSPESRTRVRLAQADLDGDRQDEVIVYLEGQSWCGSGGCTALVLRRRGASYRIVTSMTIVRLPILVLNQVENGWKSLAVRVGGGGIRPHEAVLPFNGKSYPTNPSVSPSRRQDTRADGTVAISEATESIALD